MTQYLPANLLALFAPRDPIPYLPPVDKLPYEKQTAGYTGISAFVAQFEDPGKTPAPLKLETREERQERKRKAKAEATAYKLEQDIALWSPTNNPLSTSDPYKTLFVARVNYDTSEAKLRREFEIYGTIKKITIVHNKDGKPRGYAFIEYERERDMHSAYKHADGKKIDGRRVLVDVERGRTVKGWLPRRLGGGLGGTRRGGPDVNVKHSGREETRNEDRDRYAGGKERAVERERERPERPERRRSRSRSRDRSERRRRSRSRSRERHRGGDRHKRDRSRDRNRDRNAVPEAEKTDTTLNAPVEAAPNADAPRERRRRSRDRDHKRRRSRSRDRKRRDHDRGDRDHDRDRRKSDRGAEKPAEEPLDVTIKEEPVDPEPSQDGFNNSEYEGGEYNNNNNNNNSYDNNNGETNEASENFSNFF